jgi:hypothetical protein
LRQVRDRHAGPRGGSRFARELGIKDTTYRSYEEGVHPPISVVLRIVAKTNVNLLWLLTGAGSMDSPQDSVLDLALRKAITRLGTAASLLRVQAVALESLLLSVGSYKKYLAVEFSRCQMYMKKLRELDTHLPLRAIVHCKLDRWEDVISSMGTSARVAPELYQPDRFIIDVRGLAMDPEVKPGDLCIFDPRAQPEDGSIVAVQDPEAPEHGTIRYYDEKGSGIELFSGERERDKRLDWFKLERATELYLVDGSQKRRWAIKGVLAGLSRRYRVAAPWQEGAAPPKEYSLEAIPWTRVELAEEEPKAELEKGEEASPKAGRPSRRRRGKGP